MAPSLAVFCPQSKAPQSEYLRGVQHYIRNHQHLRLLVESIQTLDQTWQLLADDHTDLHALEQGPRYMRCFSEWITNGLSDPVANVMSGIISLPLLVIVQVTQYFQFLELSGTTHVQFLAGLRKNGGGMQGYCAGLLPAFAIASAKDEADVVAKSANAMRLALAIGAYGELGDDASLDGPTTIVVRLSQPGLGEDLVAQFPGAYISAITDPKTISIVGSVQTLERLSEKARDQGLLVSAMHLRGKVHNPENLELATKLDLFCQRTEQFQLGSSTALQVVVNSNLDGLPIQDRPLTREAVYTILASRCEWYKLLENVASSLAASEVRDHEFTLFGIGDPVPLAPFHQARLRITKVDVYGKIRKSQLGRYNFNNDAIAIVGSSCRLPGANSLEELWDLMASETSTCEEIRPQRIPIHASFRASQDKNKKKRFFGNFVDDVDSFDYAFFRTNTREAASMDPQQRLLLEVAYEAMDSSGYLRHHEREDFDRVGCFIGASFAEYLDNTSSHTSTAYTSTGTIRAFLCGRISYYFGWSGPSEIIDTACSSSLVAIHRACQAIRAGECSMALTGGVNIMSGVHNFLDLSKAGFLSQTGQCKPFDMAADGYARSDGVGLVVLKPLRDAQANGDQILGVITGVATNQGGLSSSITVPHSPSQVELYRRILSQSGMSPDHVSYVEAHGTGTQAGDPLEIASIRSVFGGSDRVASLHVGSLKGNIGHAETAAGVAGLLKVLAMLNKSSIPPLTSHKSLNPKIPALAADKMVIDKAVQAWDVPIRVACVNSYGAAGSNAALLCAEAPSSNASHNRTTTQSTTPDSVSEIGVPIILSAANKDSLLSYCKSLGGYLDRNPQVEIGNLAFTLAERRKRHRFALTAAVKELKELRHVLDNPTDIREIPSPGESKGIILAFSGQSKRCIGLDSSLYHASPRFQARIQDCEALLVEMGYPSIMANLFGTSPASDVVVLQTGTFAVQYASALCWIDSGLKVDACIGHSFGELTALVVTGVLSLQDGLRLVATRASLMESVWGPERGTMLAIHGHREMVHEVVDRVGADMLEVACYNSRDSQVIVGSAESIQQAEELLRSEPRYAQTKSQRLDVTHGFHSRFTEPLLNDLEGLSKSLHFSTTPRIHMETCTADPDISFGPRYINQHTRSPVYFADAVHRLEARFSSCTWVEAGQASPIMAMIKRATDQRDSHKYYSLGQEGSTLLSLTTKLWNDGVDVSFWPFLTPAESGVQQISLPSYRFTKTTAWMENIDRASEAHELLAEANSSPGSYERDSTRQAAAPPVLVSLGERQDPKTATFTIHCDTERFGGIVKGHAVRNRALCPASMYMECATMAMQTLGTDLRGDTLCFEGVQFESPLGVNLTRHVTLTALQDTKKTSSWKFAVSSSPKEDRSSKLTTHGKGSITLGSSPNLNAYQRLATERAQELESKPGTEKLMGKRAYGLFSQVVTYSEFLRGISSITMDGRQAVADIHLSSGHMGENDSSAIDLCDTVATDNFIQVVGLLINSGPHCPQGEVFVATGVDTAILSGAGGFLKSKSFKVYAMYTMISDTQSTGDIFIMRPDYTLVGVILGAAFTKLPINTLEKLLDTANKGSSAVKPKATVQDEQPRAFHHDESTGTVGLEKDWQGDSGYSSDGVATPQSDTDHQANHDKLTAIVCEYTGVTPDTLSEDDTMTQLGIDSLGSAEMASELQSQFGKTLTSEELMEATLKSLTNLLIGSPMVPASMLGKPGLPPAKSAAVAKSKRPAAPENGKNEQKRAKIVAMVAEMAGADPSSVVEGITLSELGVDSLASVQLKGDLENAFDLEIDDDDFDLAMTVGDICRLANVTENNAVSIAGDTSNLVTPTTSAKGADLEPVTSRGNGITATPVQQEKINFACVGDPAMALKLSESDLPSWAAKCGYDSYWSVISRKQDEIVVAYILEAYRQLGLDLSSLSAGKSVEGITYLPKHEKLMQRIWQILQKHGIIERTEQGSFIRTAKIWPSTPAQQLSASFLADFPRYQSEAQLMAVTGPKLAGCLAGKDNPVALLFSNATSQKALEAYYQTSPMLATATELLVDMITRSVSHADGSAPVRILEIGAGFGGTSRRLLEALETTGVQVEYTFTDIAPTLINRASKTFAHVRGMTFKTLDIEKAPPAALCGRYDIVLGTNCIHATSDRTRSIRHIKDLLHPEGYMVLSEVTEIVDWYDIVYGLLEGWWLAKEGIYPLQPPESWVQCFRDAGFARENVMVSDGPSRDLRTQRLLLASRKALAGNAPPRSLHVQPLRKTVVYKEAYGVPIHADIYLPRDVTTQAMPVALMVHGGGHMTLSRTAIRPTQVEFLLANGILPVSLDYRLCPEVNLIDGPITDVRDAYLWAQRSLKSIVSQWDIAVDDTKIAVIGWSSGGHLATSLAWTAKQVGAVPPSAVLSFYGPTDFESGALDARRAEEYPERKMSLKEIMRKLPRKPITGYDNGKVDSTGLGWVKPGDPRSELVLSLFKEGNGLPLMLNGLTPAGDAVDDRNAFGNAKDVDPAKVASISPLAQVTSGGYGAVPTFLVHGTEDELVPYESARTFVDALRRAGVDCGLLTVPGARHIHDMDIKTSTTKWEKEVAPAYEFLMTKLMQ